MYKSFLNIGVLASVLLLITACGSSSSSNNNSPKPSQPSHDFASAIYSTHTVTTVNYGRSQNINGITSTQSMDIYQPPAEDTNTARPLIIFAHGGFFVGGDKNQAEEYGVGEFFAQSGYVLASISYRLIPSTLTISLNTLVRLNLTNPAQVTTGALSVVAGLDAASDMRAAIRYFLADQANTNTYKIDINNIFVSGYSAGAFTALGVGLSQSLDNLPKDVVSSPTVFLSIPSTFAESYMRTRGGIKGDNDGNQSYSSTGTIKGIVNIAGAVGSLDVIKADSPPIYNIAGDADDTVPIGKGVVEESGNVVVYGAEEISSKTLSVGSPSRQHLLGGVGHDLWSDCKTTKVQCDDIKTRVRTFLSEIIAK